MPAGITKAFLLAAGLGTRLRPLTDNVPKCLVPIHGRPLLSVWLDFCNRLHIREVLINTHHLASEVGRWAREQNSAVKIDLFHETTLLGSAGTIAANRAFIGESHDFYVFYADNLVSTDLALLESLHASHRGVLTMGLFRTPKPRDCGIVTLNTAGKVLSFEEKPSHPRSDLASAGIFIARQSLFNYLPAGFADLGKDVMPRLVGSMWGQVLGGYLLDIGTHDNYARALREWPSAGGTPTPAAGEPGGAP